MFSFVRESCFVLLFVSVVMMLTCLDLLLVLLTIISISIGPPNASLIHEDPAVAHGADQRETRMQIETRTDLMSGSSSAKTAAEEVISQPAGSSACSRGASISSGKAQVAEALAHFRLFPFPLVPLPVAVGLLAGHGQLCRSQGTGWAD